MKSKKIIALLLTLVLTLAIAAPAMAFTTDVINPFDNPEFYTNQWTLTEVNHWVVRGDTLATIAATYGTTPAEIRANNARYFTDLERRNRTMGINIELEYGIKLFIYHQVTVRRYVQRGDTLENLADGSRLRRGDGFAIVTTPAAIRAENAGWFENLARLNTTLGTNFSLVESDSIFATYERLIGGAVAWRDSWSVLGSPLYITVPVKAVFCTDILCPCLPFNYTTAEYLRSSVETDVTATLSVNQINPAWVLPDYQRTILNTLRGDNPLPGVSVGSFEYHNGLEYFKIDTNYVPGVYRTRAGSGGAVSGGTSGGTVASTNRFSAPIDVQPAGWVMYRNDARGNGNTVLANLARDRGTTVADLKAKNPNYFAFVNSRGVAFEYGAIIWVPAK